MGRLQSKIQEHLMVHWWVYLSVGICFIAGLVFGSLAVNTLDDGQISSLEKFLEAGLDQFSEDLNMAGSAKQALLKNLVTLNKLFILGLTVIGFPLILTVIFTRGFALGFTTVFLIQEKSLVGGALSLLAIIPPHLLSLPAYILAAVAAINFTIYLIRGCDRSHGTPLVKYFLGYLLFMLALAFLLIGAAFIEGYLSPLAIRMLTWT